MTDEDDILSTLGNKNHDLGKNQGTSELRVQCIIKLGNPQFLCVNINQLLTETCKKSHRQTVLT